MKKEDVLFQIDQTVEKALSFINEALITRNDVNKTLLGEYKGILQDFQKGKNIDVLFKLRKISYRPTPEGAEADYTEGTPVYFEGEYLTLRDLLLKIEDLTAEIEKL